MFGEKKIKVNELGRKKSGQERNSWQRAKHAWLYSDLLHVFKGRIFVSSGFSKEGTLISASTILHCREVQKQNHSRKFILHKKDFGLMVYHTPAFNFRDLSKKIFKKKKKTISNLCRNQSWLLHENASRAWGSPGSAQSLDFLASLGYEAELVPSSTRRKSPAGLCLRQGHGPIW